MKSDKRMQETTQWVQQHKELWLDGPEENSPEYTEDMDARVPGYIRDVIRKRQSEIKANRP